eukprot:TRINITY_DN5912_c0_g1_i11.p3 TRINITY_DN5912_c0_g1~~TRINITY_DN5912_c0_g1_i11.p3  ORF type:complete len:147 (+),score=25.44 TRINITY_DN5912_c0_g1_i11:173-613(+)
MCIRDSHNTLTLFVFTQMKDKFGDECKICKRPYTVFKWKACAQGRFKRTVVCQTCAKLKNVCQTCLFDLTYGLPVELRDKMLGENKVIIPKSQANLDYWSNQANTCLLYTSDAADDMQCVDLGGRRIIKKKKKTRQSNPPQLRRQE